MADNFSVTPGSGVDIRAVEKSSKKAQTVTADIGGAGAEKLLTAGRQADADSVPAALSTEDVAILGATNETAPASDTATSGLNGRLQRIAQNLTSYLGANSGAAVVTDASGTIQQYLRGLVKFFADALGAGTAAAAHRVTHASDDPVTVAVQIMDDWDQADRAKVTVAHESGVMVENAVAVTVKRAAIAAASSGNNTLLSGVSGKKIRVLSMALVAAGTVNIYFTSAAGGTVIFGGSTNKINLVAGTGLVLPYNPHGWFEVTTDAHALVMNLSAAIAVSGGFTYIEAE